MERYGSLLELYAHAMLLYHGQQFVAAAERARAAGMEFEREPDAAWPHFKGWRVNYEAAAYILAAELDVVPALWSGPRLQPEEPRAAASTVMAATPAAISALLIIRLLSEYMCSRSVL